MPVTEAQKRATAKYEKENYDKVLVRFPKGTKERILKAGAGSVNGYIIKCVLDSLANSQNGPETPEAVQRENNIQEPLKIENKTDAEETGPEKQLRPASNLADLQSILNSKRAEIVAQKEANEKAKQEYEKQEAEARKAEYMAMVEKWRSEAGKEEDPENDIEYWDENGNPIKNHREYLNVVRNKRF